MLRILTTKKISFQTPLIKDDQAKVANISDKGLVILTGCGHAGVVNTMNYAKKITGINRIYAIIGGFHLPADGGIYEAAIEPTLKELQRTNLTTLYHVIVQVGKQLIELLKLCLRNLYKAVWEPPFSFRTHQLIFLLQFSPLSTN